MGLVDLHVHTNYSDGLYSPKEIIEKAINLNLNGISITDHDNMEGVEEVINIIEKENYRLYYIPGCEFSTNLEGLGEVHILGYFTDNSYKNLSQLFEEFQNKRLTRAYKIIDSLKKNGIVIDEKFIYDNKGPIGRMHIAREIVKNGFANNVKEAFDNYLRNGAPCYIPKEDINTVDIIKILKENNGKPVLAHPKFLNKKENWDYLKLLINEGIEGVEVIHPLIDINLHFQIKEYINNEINNRKNKNIFFTGGSDYHGDLTYDKIGMYGIELREFLEIFYFN